MRLFISRSLTITCSLFVGSLAFAQPAADRVTFWTSSSTQSGDDALIWKSSTNRLGINASNPTAVLQAMYDSNSALVELGGQTRETLARAFAVADGSVNFPAAVVNPTFVVERIDATDDPGAYIPFEFGVKKQSGAGFLYALHSYVEVDSPTLTDSVATTGSIVMAPTSTPLITQTGFGMWARAERTVTGTRIASAEFDCFNSSGVDAPAPFAGDTKNITLGLQIVGGADNPASSGLNAKNTMALLISAALDDQGQHPGAWWGGIVFDVGSIANFGYGIDFRKIGVNATPIRLGNNTYMQARNAADSSDIIENHKI